jgi:type IV secretory pathway VirB2 component (pilin)
MFKTHEISIGPIFRFLIGALGILVAVTGLFLSVREVWFAFQGEWFRLLSALLLLIIMFGGVSLLRSAIRGRLSIRSYRAEKKM